MRRTIVEQKKQMPKRQRNSMCYSASNQILRPRSLPTRTYSYAPSCINLSFIWCPSVHLSLSNVRRPSTITTSSSVHHPLTIRPPSTHRPSTVRPAHGAPVWWAAVARVAYGSPDHSQLSTPDVANTALHPFLTLAHSTLR